MIMVRSSLRVVLGLPFALALAGCNSTGCGTATLFRPTVTQLYPVPGTSSVPTNVGILIYASSGGGVPISLVGAEKTIETSPTSLPSPLPSPIAAAPSGSSEFAVQLPPLANAQTYSVSAVVSLTGCGQEQATTYTVAEFTTL